MPVGVKGAASVGVVITAACMAAAGVPAQAQTLEEALVLAYQNNPSLRAARARVRAADEGIARALSGWRPTIRVIGEGGWNQSETDFGTGAPVKPETTHPRGGRATIDQNIFRGGSTVAGTRRAEANVESERARLAQVEQNVLINATTAYMDVVRDTAIIELNQSNEKVLLRQLEAARDRFRVGEVTRTDVAQAESRLARARADRIRAEGSLVQSRASFRNVMGGAPGKLVPAKPPADTVSSQEEAVSRARQNAFGVVQAKFAEEAARRQVREIVGELLPRVDVNGEAEMTQQRFNRESETTSYSGTLRLTIPLYQAGGVYARIREAKQVAGQRRDEYRQAIRDAVEGGARSWEALKTARARIRAFSSEIRAAEIALEGVRQEALVGSRTVLDVLDAEQELLDARVNLVTALRDEVVAAYQLRAATGDLTARKLGLPVKYYDPKVYHDENRGRWFGTSID